MPLFLIEKGSSLKIFKSAKALLPSAAIFPVIKLTVITQATYLISWFYRAYAEVKNTNFAYISQMFIVYLF